MKPIVVITLRVMEFHHAERDDYDEFQDALLARVAQRLLVVFRRVHIAKALEARIDIPQLICDDDASRGHVWSGR